jgi:hypothetical protein
MGRWTNSRQSPKAPVRLTYENAKRVLYGLDYSRGYGRYRGEFEIRPLVDNPDHKCSECGMKIPHTMDNECVSCQALKVIGGLEDAV